MRDPTPRSTARRSLPPTRRRDTERSDATLWGKRQTDRAGDAVRARPVGSVPGIRYRRSGAAFCVDEGASPASIRLGAASAASSERGVRNADMGSALDITHGFQSAPGQLDEEVVGFVQRVDAERPQWTALSRSSCPRSACPGAEMATSGGGPGRSRYTNSRSELGSISRRPSEPPAHRAWPGSAATTSRTQCSVSAPMSIMASNSRYEGSL